MDRNAAVLVDREECDELGTKQILFAIEIDCLLVL
jgi:hypothetical protein